MIESNISKGRRSFHASLGLGGKGQAVPSLCLSKLYWSVAFPQMMCGLELVNISATNEHTMETIHASIAKIIQGLPKQTSGPAVLSPLVWCPIYALIAYRCFMFLWRNLLMPVDSSCKVMALVRIVEAHTKGISSIVPGPLRCVIDFLCEYKLFDHVVGYAVGGCYCPIEE
jgi:hypothetical protein